MRRPRIVFIRMGMGPPPTFVRRELEVLRKIGDVKFLNYEGKKNKPADFGAFISFLIGACTDVWDADAIISFFVPTKMLPFVLLARLLGKPFIGIIGGYETRLNTLVSKWLIGSALRFAKFVIVPSSEVRQKIQLLYKVDSIVSPQAVEMVECKNKKREGVLMIAHMPNWHEDRVKIKGMDYFVKLARLLPDLNFTLLGVSPKEFQAYFPSKFGEEIPKNLTILPPMPFEKVKAHICSAKVYVQLSRHETFCHAIIEAISSGCPAAAWSAGNLTRLLPPDHRCPLGDIECMKALIKRLYQGEYDKEKWHSHVMKIRKEFSMERREKMWRKLLKELKVL